MFDQLVVSNGMRREHKTAKFFIGTSALYIVALASAFVVSVLVSDPRLADSANFIGLVGQPASVSGNAPRKPPPSRTPARERRPDLNHLMDLDTLASRRSNLPPAIEIGRAPGGESSLPYIGPIGQSIGPVTGGERSVEPPPNPDPPKPKPAAQTTVAENKPLRVTSVVLQGKAVERRTPPYPHLAKLAGIHGAVSVEVVISPEGRVESARSVSGHPTLRKAAEDAARGWRFDPTLLNQVPVRVTGVITFVFKLNE